MGQNDQLCLYPILNSQAVKVALVICGFAIHELENRE